MHAGIRRHVLAHVVHADAHQFDRVQCAAPQLRRRRGVRGSAVKRKIDAGVGQRQRRVDAGERCRMPGDRDIHVAERTGAGHEAFRRTTFLGRAAVVADAALDAVGFQVVLHRRGGEQGGGAEQVVAAAMAETGTRQRFLFRDAGLLRQAGQRVVFAEDGDHRAVLTGLAHHGGGDAGDVAGDAESFRPPAWRCVRRRNGTRYSKVPAFPRRDRTDG